MPPTDAELHELQLADNAVQLAFSFFADKGYNKFFGRYRNRLNWFTGIQGFVSKVAIWFTDVETKLNARGDLWDDYDWPTAIDATVTLMQNTGPEHLDAPAWWRQQIGRIIVNSPI